MTSKRIALFAALALFASAAALMTSSPAAAEIPAAPWEGKEVGYVPFTKQFPPVQPGLANRPSILLETDFYVYGPGTGFSVPDVNLTVDARGFNQPVTLWLYWEDRSNGATMYYSLRTGSFGATPRDMFGLPGAPAKVRVPTLDEFGLFGAGTALGALPGSIPTATGCYQFVFEVRNAAGTTVIARGNAMYNHVDAVVSKSGNIGGSETWTANNAYRLAAPVNVLSPAVLTIQAGTVVLGSKDNEGTLVIQRGARINAVGTPDKPIIMSSELPVGQRNSGDWGGLVVNGFAPTNQSNPQGEGNSGPYGAANGQPGGGQPADNSGTLQYLRVEFAGILFSDQNELNGIALQGVGNGTTVDHVQIHRGEDDGIEFFGGTVDAKFILVTDANDDSLDWTFGWTGRLQHFVAIQRRGDEDFCIEADNFESNNDALPRSNPRIANATFIGKRNIPGADVENCILFRRGTGVNMTHSIQMLGNANGIQVVDQASLDLLGTDLTVENTYFFNNAALTDNADVATYLMAPAQDNRFTSPSVPNPQSIVQPDVAPTGNVTVGPLPALFDADPFFDSTTYAGGVNPANSWIDDGWTVFSDD
jgi:hypothetical protein